MQHVTTHVAVCTHQDGLRLDANVVDLEELEEPLLAVLERVGHLATTASGLCQCVSNC